MSDQPQTLNKLELTSVYALLAYAAYDRKISEGIIRESVIRHFRVDDIAQLPSHAYDDVIRFLVDTQISPTIH